MSSQHPRSRAAPRVSTPTTEWKAPKLGVSYASAVQPSGFHAGSDRFSAEFPCDRKGLHRYGAAPKQGKFKAPPIGIGARKASKMVQEKNTLKPSEDGKTDVKDEESLNCNQLKSVTGKFARPLLPVLGENLAQSWQDITKAPVAFQVQELLGDRVTRSRSSLTEIQSLQTADEVDACTVRTGSCSTPHMTKSNVNIAECKYTEKVTTGDSFNASNLHGSLPSISPCQSMLHTPCKYGLEPRFHNDVDEGFGTSLRENVYGSFETKEGADSSMPLSTRTNQMNSGEFDEASSSRLVYFPSSNPSSTISLSSNASEMASHLNYDELESTSHGLHKSSIEDLSASSHEAFVANEANEQIGEHSRPLMTNGAVGEFLPPNSSSIAALPSHLNAPTQKKYSGIVYFPGSESSANSSASRKKSGNANFCAEFY